MTDPTSIAQSVNAGTPPANLPGLTTFSAAWSALRDFVGSWASTTPLDIQAIGDTVGTTPFHGPS